MTINEDYVYAVTDGDRAPFGTHWRGPALAFPKFKETLVAAYRRKKKYGGQDAKVYAKACSSRFYTVKVAATHSKPAYTVHTGAGEGCAELAARIAEQVSMGMLEFKAA